MKDTVQTEPGQPGCRLGTLMRLLFRTVRNTVRIIFIAGMGKRGIPIFEKRLSNLIQYRFISVRVVLAGVDIRRC